MTPLKFKPIGRFSGFRLEDFLEIRLYESKLYELALYESKLYEMLLILLSSMIHVLQQKKEFV